jgi:hypothetical protein
VVGTFSLINLSSKETQDALLNQNNAWIVLFKRVSLSGAAIVAGLPIVDRPFLTGIKLTTVSIKICRRIEDD